MGQEVSEVWGSEVIEGFLRDEQHLESDSFPDREPVEVLEDGCDMFTGVHSSAF